MREGLHEVWKKAGQTRDGASNLRLEISLRPFRKGRTGGMIFAQLNCARPRFVCEDEVFAPSPPPVRVCPEDLFLRLKCSDYFRC